MKEMCCYNKKKNIISKEAAISLGVRLPCIFLKRAPAVVKGIVLHFKIQHVVALMTADG